MDKSKVVALLLVLAVVAVIAGSISYLSDETSVGSKINTFIQNPTAFVLGNIGKEVSLVTFNAVLTAGITPDANFEFFEVVDSIKIEYFNADNVFYLGSFEQHTDKQTTLELRDFKGTLNVKDSLTFDGSVKQVRVNEQYYTYPTKRIPVKANNIVYDSVEFKNTPSISLNLEKISGTINLEGGDSYNINNKELSLSSFTGDITVSGNMITLNGVGKIKTSTLTSQ